MSDIRDTLAEIRVTLAAACPECHCPVGYHITDPHPSAVADGACYCGVPIDAAIPADGVIVTPDSLARAIHDGRIAVAKHGKFTDRCICNALAAAIMRGVSKLVPKPSLDQVIAEFAPLAPAPSEPKRKRIDWSDVVVDEGDEAP
jgi:hypothetical protein